MNMIGTRSNSPDAFVCTVCHLPIAQSQPHLRRDQPHSHACPFCPKTFGRADGARRHAKSCPQRGNRPLPPEAKRGRKLRACDQCSRVKAQCDGKQPCRHCSSREPRLSCTFSRFCSDSSHRRRDDEASKDSHGQDAARGSGGEPSSTLSFLFNLTGPGGDSAMARVIADEPESNIQAPAVRRSLPSDADLSLNIDSGFNLQFDGCIDPALLFTSFMDPCLEAETGMDIDVLGVNESQQDMLTIRLSQLSSELREFAAAKTDFLAFDSASFDKLFDPSQVQRFASALSSKRHFQYPLIHWPTFVLEDACLPLLLAISLTGAVYSRQSSSPEVDEASHLRNYYPIAEAYIFKGLKRCIAAASPATSSTSTIDYTNVWKDKIEHLQAGLLVFVLTVCSNDANMLRTIVSKRHVTLVTALRLFGLVGSKHDSSEDWERFAQNESRIRLVAWTFFSDCLTTVFCNQPPLMILSEVSGHLPCSQAVWDANSADEFAKVRRAEEDAGVGFLSLDTLTAGLLRDDWAGADAHPYKQLNFHHLNAIICALQPTIFNLHTLPFPSTTSLVLLRALDRWKMLWETTTVRIASDQRRWLGVERNSPGLALLSRRIIEVNETEAGKACKYLQRMPKHDFSDIHEFIREYCC